MKLQNGLARTARYVCVFFGLFLLYWGIMSIVSVAYAASVTVPWLDQMLLNISEFVWLPAAGVLLIALGVSPTIAPRARNSRIIRILSGVLGLGFLCLSGFFVFLTLSPFWGFVYISPLFVTGILLLATGFEAQRFGTFEPFSS